MKKVPLKRKTPMKRTAFKSVLKKVVKKPKKKVVKISTLKNKLWELCKQIIRKRDGNVCFTCGKGGLEGSSWHTGHFIPSGACGAFLRYDLRNLASQCYNCNINLGGNGTAYYRNMAENNGQEFVDQIFKDKQKVIKADAIFYQDKIDEYTKLLKFYE